MTSDRFDYVVVGGGSAGAVLAAMLSEDPSRTVLLLEAGVAYGRDNYPAILLDPERIGGDQEHAWNFHARAGRTGALNREIGAPRGKVLGGSSAINATVALRALPSDFADWTARGLSGWSWDEVLETYRQRLTGQQPHYLEPPRVRLYPMTAATPWRPKDRRTCDS